MGDWIWTNDNNKYKHNNSDSVNFSMMIKLKESTMKFVITSHVSYIQIIAKKINLELFLCGKSYCLFHRYWWFSPLHRKCTIDYQYLCQYSYSYLSTCPRVRVQVWVLSLWNSRVRVQYEYQKFSTRVLRIRVPSTSTPALVLCLAINVYMIIRWTDFNEACNMFCVIQSYEWHHEWEHVHECVLSIYVIM